MSLSKLTFGVPHDGWVELKIDADSYYFSYTTDIGKDILRAATYNFTNGVLNGPTTILADGEDTGTYYLTFEHGELTICHTEENWCKHYYFGSSFTLLYTIYSQIDEIKGFWTNAMNEDLTESLKEAQKHICPLNKEVREKTLQAVRRYCKL